MNLVVLLTCDIKIDTMSERERCEIKFCCDVT